MYLIICYAIHEKQIASVQPKESYEDALDFLIKDAENTYNEEIANSGNDPSEIDMDIIDDTACVTDRPAECTWTWKIIHV